LSIPEDLLTTPLHWGGYCHECEKFRGINVLLLLFGIAQIVVKKPWSPIYTVPNGHQPWWSQKVRPGVAIGGAPGQSADLVIIEIHHNNLINLHIACAARSCMIFSFVCSIDTSVELSEAAPSSEGRFVDTA